MNQSIQVDDSGSRFRHRDHPIKSRPPNGIGTTQQRRGSDAANNRMMDDGSLVPC